MKKLIKFLTGRLFITCIFLLIQFLILFLVFYYLSNQIQYYYIGTIVASAILAITIANDDSNPSFKIAWIIPMLIFPLFGAPLYLIFSRSQVNYRINRRLENYKEIVTKYLPIQNDVLDELWFEDPSIAKQFKYISQASLSPVYKNTLTQYFAFGQDFYVKAIEELEKAEKFIFLEYFIIDFGEMWSTILNILKRKSAQGVEIRLMYDDLGTIQLLPKDYPKKLASYGIKTTIFNRFHASLDAFLNYRDHRKILVIDGHVGFTGGLNLADEYINKVQRFGVWKDTAVMLKGEAVAKLTETFLQLWHFSNNEHLNEYINYVSTKKFPSDGYVQPFSDGPADGKLTGKLGYMGIINNAKRYVHITTPYLILDNEMITALTLAAESGVDVKIITPHIPDKKIVFALTRANYKPLLRAGVKIYEYLPGFIHAKMIVADDEIAIVGTANFDFRSFYLHFENGVMMYKSSCVAAVENDFSKTLLESMQMDFVNSRNKNPFYRFGQMLLKIFSPLL